MPFTLASITVHLPIALILYSRWARRRLGQFLYALDFGFCGTDHRVHLVRTKVSTDAMYSRWESLYTLHKNAMQCTEHTVTVLKCLWGGQESGLVLLKGMYTVLRAVLSFASFTVYVLYYLLFRQKEQDREHQVRREGKTRSKKRPKNETFFDHKPQELGKWQKRIWTGSNWHM